MKTNKGFSLIEMMLVVAIIGIAASIAVPFFNNYRHGTNLKEAARNLSAEISLCKQRAIAENVYYKITFDTAANSYTTFRGGQLASDPFVNFETKNLSDISSQIVICDITFTGTPPQIILYSRGTTSAGRVILRHTIINKNARITTNLTGRINASYNTGSCP